MLNNKVLAVAAFLLILTLCPVSVKDAPGLAGCGLGFETRVVLAATDNSQFQNNDSWFVNWKNKIMGGLSFMGSWFQGFTQKAVNPQQRVPVAQTPINQLTQFPVVNKAVPNQSVSSSRMPTSGGGSSGSGSQASGPENGAQKLPYVLEPNQFKKVCGENKYVLWWSKRGSDGKDIQDFIKDKEQNGKLIIPSCRELAKCHCCCNTCTNDSSSPCPPDVCFSINSPCDSKPICNTKCYCSKCHNECEQYTEPFHPQAFNSDCHKEGESNCNAVPECPNGDGCQVVLYQADSGWTVNAYNNMGTSVMLIPRYQTQKGAIDIDNYSKPRVIQTEGPDLSKSGWASKLQSEKGSCCKCVDEGQAKQGPGGSTVNQGGGGTGSQGGQSPVPTLPSGNSGTSGTTNPYTGATQPYSQDQLVRMGFVKNSDGTYSDPVLGTKYQLGSDGFYHPTR